jgi:murein tripeptide amidase MpaA
VVKLLINLTLAAVAFIGVPSPRAGAFAVEGDEESPPFHPETTPPIRKAPLQAATVGFSVEGRPTDVVGVGEGPTARLIIPGIHGGSEANTASLAKELVDYLTLHPETRPPRVTLNVLPRLNPDGATQATGPDGRTDAHGVALNRNWPALWAPLWDRSGCWDLAPTTGGGLRRPSRRR